MMVWVGQCGNLVKFMMTSFFEGPTPGKICLKNLPLSRNSGPAERKRLSRGYYPLHRIEFGPPKYFPKTFRFSITLYSTVQIFGGGAAFDKHTDHEKKNWNSRNSRAISRNLLEPFLRSRKAENLYGHCAMNNAKRILSKGFTLLRGCWFWMKKLRFRLGKNFGMNFNAVERVTPVAGLVLIMHLVVVVVVFLLIQLNPRAQNVSTSWREPQRRYNESELRPTLVLKRFSKRKEFSKHNSQLYLYCGKES